MLSSSTGSRYRVRGARWRGERIDWSGYAFIVPFLVPFFLFIVAPLAFGVIVSLTDWRIAQPPEFVGIENYQRALEEPLAWKALGTAIRYTVLIVPSVTLIGLVLAMFVNQRWPGYGLARVAFFSPYITSATVIGLVWVWMLDTNSGIINQYFGVRIPWLTSTTWSWVGVSIATIWWDLGLAFVLFLAGLQNIDSEVREAATVDGASRFQAARYVVVPLLRPTLSLVLTLQVISTLRIFSQIDLMTSGGPSASSMSIVYYIYQYGIQRFDLGYAAAVSMLLFVVILVITIAHRRLIREQI